MEPLDSARLQFEHLDGQRLDAAVARIRGCARHEFVRPGSNTHGQIEVFERPLRSHDPVVRLAVDTAHLQIRRALPAVVYERRDGIEFIEHVVPYHTRTRGIVHEYLHCAARCRARLQNRLPRTSAQFVRCGIAFDDTAAIGLIGKHRSRVVVMLSSSKRAPRYGQAKRGHVNAEQHARSFRR